MRNPFSRLTLLSTQGESILPTKHTALMFHILSTMSGPCRYNYMGFNVTSATSAGGDDMRYSTQHNLSVKQYTVE